MNISLHGIKSGLRTNTRNYCPLGKKSYRLFHTSCVGRAGKNIRLEAGLADNPTQHLHHPLQNTPDFSLLDEEHSKNSYDKLTKRQRARLRKMQLFFQDVKQKAYWADQAMIEGVSIKRHRRRDVRFALDGTEKTKLDEWEENPRKRPVEF